MTKLLRQCSSCFAFVLLSASLVAAQPSKRVLLIGIDGAGGQYVPQANTPNLDALVNEGVARFDFLNEGALAVDPPEAFGASGVNWSTILTGASASNHGVVDNSFTGSQFDEAPHFFEHVKQFDSSLATVSLANWTPINEFITPDSVADFERGYDIGTIFTQDTSVKNDAVSLFTTGLPTSPPAGLSTIDPDVVFLHFDQVDSAGHSFSWGSAQHIAAIETVDGLIGEIMAAINSRPGVVSGNEDWLVLVSADHGAAEGAFGHVASQGLPNWQVPFIASGPSVTNGALVQQGTLRDIAPTALWHLGIDPFLAGLDGTVRGLTVTPPSGIPGDLNGDGLVAGNGRGSAASDDVTAFVNNWLVTGGGGITDRYARGDLNLDGITDLSDWALLNNLDPSVGQSILTALSQPVPEPATLLLLASVPFAIIQRRRLPTTHWLIKSKI